MILLARSPNQKAEKARELYKGGMKLVEIASQLEVPAGTVRRWKSTYHWDNEQQRELQQNDDERDFFNAKERKYNSRSTGIINNIVNCLGNVISSDNIDLITKEKACETLVKIACEKNARKKICDIVCKSELKKRDAISESQWNRCMDFFRDKSGKSCCAYCGIQTKQLEKDHVIPFSKGGCASADNILPACKRCNTAKNDKNIYDWYTRSNVFSKYRMKKIVEYLKEVGGDVYE